MTAKKKKKQGKSAKPAKRRAAPAERSTHVTTMRIDAELWAEAQRLAEIQHTSATSVIEQCLQAGLPKLEKLYAEFQRPESQDE